MLFRFAPSVPHSGTGSRFKDTSLPSLPTCSQAWGGGVVKAVLRGGWVRKAQHRDPPAAPSAHLGWGTEAAGETLRCSPDHLGTLAFSPHLDGALLAPGTQAQHLLWPGTGLGTCCGEGQGQVTPARSTSPSLLPLSPQSSPKPPALVEEAARPPRCPCSEALAPMALSSVAGGQCCRPMEHVPRGPSGAHRASSTPAPHPHVPRADGSWEWLPYRRARGQQ